MASRDAYLDHLASVSLFSACSKQELRKIARAGDEIRFSPGDVLVDQGDTGRECYVLLEGTASVRRNDRRIATVGPGECVGELSLLDRGPRTATVVADTDIDALLLTSRAFSGVLDDVPSLARKVMAALAARVRELDSKIYT